MEKSKLNKFISKYYLNGIVDSVVWHSNGTLSTKFVDDTKSLVGEVVCDKYQLPNGEFGINQTSKLKSLLSVIGDNIEVEVKSKNNISTLINIFDSNVNINYMLADPNVIPRVPTLEKTPDWDVVLNLNSEFIENFIKASNALSDVKEFAVITKQSDETVSLVVGHSNINTTKVAISTDVKSFKNISPTYFSTIHLKEILLANKEAKNGSFKISGHGLAKITFNVDDFNCTYYLASKLQNDN